MPQGQGPNVRLFTKANAAEFGRKGQAVMRRRRVERILSQVTQAELPRIEARDYLATQLIRARTILDAIYSRAERLKGMQAHELASRAAERWTKIEFALAGRPMPGSRRPGREPMKEVQVVVRPLALAAPQVVPAPVPQVVAPQVTPPTLAPLEPKAENPAINPTPPDVSH